MEINPSLYSLSIDILALFLTKYGIKYNCMLITKDIVYKINQVSCKKLMLKRIPDGVTKASQYLIIIKLILMLML